MARGMSMSGCRRGVTVSAMCVAVAGVMERLGRHLDLAPERLEVGAEGVESRQACREDRGDEEDEVDRSCGPLGRAGLIAGVEDLVLAPEAGQQREAREGERADEERRVRYRHDVAEAAESSHVDDVAHRVHHRAGPQEQ